MKNDGYKYTGTWTYDAILLFVMLLLFWAGQLHAEIGADWPPISKSSEAELQTQAKQALKAGRLDEAKRLLTTGANASYASSQYDLGMLLIVIGQKDQGMHWLQEASQQGHSEAIKALQSLQNSP